MTEIDSFRDIELHALLLPYDLPRDTLSLFAERASSNPRLSQGVQGDDTCPFHLAMLTNTCNKTAHVEAITIAEIASVEKTDSN